MREGTKIMKVYIEFCAEIKPGSKLEDLKVKVAKTLQKINVKTSYVCLRKAPIVLTDKEAIA